MSRPVAYEGGVLLIVALIMGIGTITLLFAVDFAHIFTTQAKLQLAADSAAEAGTVKVGEIAASIASQRKGEYIQKWCDDHPRGPCPPPVLPSDPMWYLKIDYLGNNDRPYLMNDAGVYAVIDQQVRALITENVKENTPAVVIKTEYPVITEYDSCNPDTQVVVKVELTQDVSVTKKTIRVHKTGLSYLSICHS